MESLFQRDEKETESPSCFGAQTRQHGREVEKDSLSPKNRIYNLISFVDSFWGTYALIEYEGKIQKVPYYRIEILKEEENEN